MAFDVISHIFTQIQNKGVSPRTHTLSQSPLKLVIDLCGINRSSKKILTLNSRVPFVRFLPPFKPF